jgi:PKD repeat protein
MGEAPKDLSGSYTNRTDCFSAAPAWVVAYTQTDCTSNGYYWNSRVVTCTNNYNSSATYDGNDACLRCHSAAAGYARDVKETYLMTGHRNMLREVLAGVPLGGPEWTAGEAGSSPYAGIDWVNAEVTGSGKGAGSLLFIYGGWYRNGVEARILQTAKTPDSPTVVESGDTSYCGAYCHTTGPNAPDATDHAPGITGTTFKEPGTQCTRCHDKSSDLPGEVASRHHDAIPEGIEVTELCYECHMQNGVEPYEVSASPSSFIGYYRTNQFLNSPHARFEGPDISDVGFYDTFFDGGCATCHDVHIGAVDSANTDQSHIVSKCGVNCHNPQSPDSRGGYAGFHDYFGGLAPDTTSTEDNCSDSIYTTEGDCTAGGEFWNPAGTVGNNPAACVQCHMQLDTNHLWRINTDMDYTPFVDPSGPANAEADAEGYAYAVWNSIEMVCGQCHSEEGSHPLVGTKLSLLQMVSFAEDYHGHGSAQAAECMISGDYCDEDADCTEDVCSITISQTCTDDDDCPLTETCETGGEVCKFFPPPDTDTEAYARFNWYKGSGCFEIHFDASDNDGATFAWDFGDGRTGSGELTSHSYPSARSYLVTLTVDGDKEQTRSVAVSGNMFQVGKPVKKSGTTPAYYLTIQDAFDFAVNGDTIKSKETSFNEDVLFDSDISILFEAGYNCGYSSITGITALNGNMIVSNGAITIQSGLLRVQ